MNDKEYTYNIDKYTIGVDENGKDEIGLTIAIIKNGKINVLGNCYGENARCIDLLIKENQELKQKYENAVADYETTMAEKEQLKKQLKDKTEDYKRMKNNFDSKVDVLTEIDTQQKEFIKYLEDEKDRLARECSNIYEDSLGHTRLVNEDKFNEVNDILQKYKSIIGDIDENNMGK